MNWSPVRYLRLPVCVIVLQPLVQNCSSLRVWYLAWAFASSRDRLRVVRDRLSHKGCSYPVTVLSLAPAVVPSSAPPAPSFPPAGAPSPLPLAPSSEDPLESHCTP